MPAGPSAALALVAPALLLAGCAGVSVEGLDGSDVAREPHYEEHRGLIAPQHEKRYAVDVPADAALLNATLHLMPRGSGALPSGLPGADAAATPAQLTLDVLDASGRALAAATVDPSNPRVSLHVKDFSMPGAWTVRVAGTGASGTVEGQDYGASYLLSIEILYP